MKFKDNKDREWDVELSIGVAMDLKDQGIDFWALHDNRFEGFIKLMSNTVEFVQFLWALIKSQADELGVSEREFYRSLSGPELEKAKEVFEDRYSNFFPDEATRSALTRLMEAGRTATRERTDRLVTLMEAKVKQAVANEITDENLNAILDQELAALRQRNLSATSGDKQAHPESEKQNSAA